MMPAYFLGDGVGGALKRGRVLTLVSSLAAILTALVKDSNVTQTFVYVGMN